MEQNLVVADLMLMLLVTLVIYSAVFISKVNFYCLY